MKFFHKSTALLTAVILLLSAVPVFSFAATLKGDIDNDGKLEFSDAEKILSYTSGFSTLTKSQKSRADVNGDGKITTADALLVMNSAEDTPVEYKGKITQLSPKEKHGSSKKVKYCKVKEYCAETLVSTPINDRSNPLYSPLPKGTYDCISSGPYYLDTAEKEKGYYILKSGRRVYKNEVSVFTGYALPDNTALLESAPTYKKRSTDFYIALDWRVPFNVTVKPQSYESGYDGREHNIKDGKFTGNYMDIKFYYTTKATGKCTFPESDIIKSTKWIINEEKETATLRVYFRNTGKFYGYKAYYNSNNYLVISVKEDVKSLSGKIIELDPGHGGTQPGAGSGTGVYEKDIAYKIALQLKKLLEKNGAKVVFSRDDSKSVPEIEERRYTALKDNPDMFISIHLDASNSSSVHGSSVYYYKNYSGPLAYSIAKNIPKSLKEIGYSMNNRDAHYYPFCVTRIENCPAVLVECGFISNTTNITTPFKGSSGKTTTAHNDFKLLNSSLGQQYIAKGIYNGILDYYGI